ncbi:MAG: hypothetical protein J2P46_08455 [Zavarzinella sp.]|nr:hypothetical protein [Zavarzinella sp.]
MSLFRLCAIPVVAGLAGLPAAAQDRKPAEHREEAPAKPLDDRRDQTLLIKLTQQAYVHEAAGVSYTVAAGWKEIGPQRLARRIDPRIMTVLRIERADRDLAASLYWIPMNPGQKLADWVRDTPVAGEYGEEYETLKAVYGKDRVTTPERIPHGPFQVYRIQIRGGPDGGDKREGTLFVFEVESGGQRWLLKARVSHPKEVDGKPGGQSAMEVLHGYAKLTEPPSAPKRAK